MRSQASPAENAIGEVVYNHWLMPARIRPILLILILVSAGLAYYFILLKTDEPEGVLKASGTIEATEVDVAFQIPGKIEQVIVAEGNPVKEGDVLARMSSDELQSRVQQIQASLDAVTSQTRQQQAALELRRGVVENQI